MIDVHRTIFGHLPDGRPVEELVLGNARGMRVHLLTYGAIVRSIYVPDRHGALADVVPGYPNLDGYLTDPNYFGAIIGRYANRISGARFALGGQTFSLAQNDGQNSLHGGPRGFSRQLWSIEDVRSGVTGSVTLQYVSPDGEEGYPGKLTTTATYSLNGEGRLDLTIEAETDQPTIVNLTGHSYFNLSGFAAGTSALDHRLFIDAEHYTPVGPDLIPTGIVAQVAGTPFDFRESAVVGSRISDPSYDLIRLANGYDHNFVLARTASTDPRLAARLECPDNGRVLELWTNQPGLQFYSGNHLGGAVPGKGGSAYRQFDALALEPQLFPDTPNQPAFGSAELLPGQRYRNQISYRFTTSR